ncbi:MAG: hypothetical protein ACKVOR_02320 [Flavobacteriales bacterium]
MMNKTDSTIRSIRALPFALTNVQLLVAGLGFLPVSGIALHSMHWIGLPVFTVAVLLPALLLLLFVCKGNLLLAQSVFYGWSFGLVAVLLYDVSRLPFIYMGWSDFIPRIGGWLTGEEENFLLGYAFRYIGNGGGLGISFLLLMTHYSNRQHILLKGLCFGLFVFAMLWMVLLLVPSSQAMMFRLSPLTIAGSLTGHIVYGLVLGYLARWYFERIPLHQ